MNHNTKKTETARMTLDEYRERLHKYNRKFLTCKDIRHVWSVQTDYTSYAENPDWFHRVLVCQRCGTVRTDYFHLDRTTNRMERGASNYRYPSGFSMRGLPQDKRLGEVMRYESFLRTIASTPQEKK